MADGNRHNRVPIVSLLMRLVDRLSASRDEQSAQFLNVIFSTFQTEQPPLIRTLSDTAWIS